MGMAFYPDEEEVWRCLKHPSKRRRSGICPICLRDRLTTLCPDCANVRPCSCCATSGTTSSSSSASSSFSLFSSSGRGDSSRFYGVGAVRRVSNLIDGEPAFRRSRSVAIPFLRSRFAGDSVSGNPRSTPPPAESQRRPSFWSAFRTHKNKKSEDEREYEEDAKRNEFDADHDYAQRETMMMRSRSVSVPAAHNSGGGYSKSSSVKGRGWYFPSPMKIFRQSKTSKVVRERSPLHRG